MFGLSDLYIKQRALLCRRETQDLPPQHAITAVRVQNAKTAGDNTRGPRNAKRWMKTYLSLPTECRGYQFAQHAHYSTPASPSQPAKKET